MSNPLVELEGDSAQIAMYVRATTYSIPRIRSPRQ
jgi:hypothetical protein